MKKVVKGWIALGKPIHYTNKVYLQKSRRVADATYGVDNVFRCTITYQVPRRKK